MTDRALRLLRENPHLAELAAFPFSFDLGRAVHGEEVRLASGGPLEPIAGDDTGGTYFVCGDGSVLYASSEGSAGVIGDSVDEALEVLVGLPGWHDHLRLAPSDGEEEILAAVARTEEEIRESYGIDAERSELRAGLGLPERSPVELVGLLHAALLRTEPDFLLLGAEEGGAHDLLDPHPRPPLWETVLARGRADLALLRAGTAWDGVAGDGTRRALALRAAQFDRRESDLPLLRHLLRHEAEASMTDELRLAAVLVGLHGLADDLPLLLEVRETDFDTWCGLGGVPEPGAEPAELLRWARDLDDAFFGTDPADEPLFTWTGLAREQGLVELARVALIRALDDLDLRVYAAERAGGAPDRRLADPLGSSPASSSGWATASRPCAPGVCTCRSGPRPTTVSRPSSDSPGWSGRRASSGRRPAHWRRCVTPWRTPATTRRHGGGTPTWACTSSGSTTRSPGPPPSTRRSRRRSEASPRPPMSCSRASPRRPGRPPSGAVPRRWPVSARLRHRRGGR
ncbi:hypothetical protein [Streptomyces sp. NPDC059466]|uniref:hypothetical protein n=1 Tax=unclassified Streptomyces TaxID=2593676 RepID=UPI00367D0B9E